MIDATHFGVDKRKKRRKQDTSRGLEEFVESTVSPKRRRRTSLSFAHTSAEEIMPPRAVRPSAEDTKSKALSKVWYEFQESSRATPCKFATWNEYLSEFSVDFSLMWTTVIRKELHARAALSLWRRYPCKRIGTTLPTTFSSWSDFHARGGIRDESTGTGSLTEYDRLHFWNDQCKCSPQCWQVSPRVVVSPATASAKRKRDQCSFCTVQPCVCEETVPRSWEDELASLRNMRRSLPFGSKAFDARIAELEKKVVRGDAPPTALKVRDILQAQSALDSERVLLRQKMAEKEELARKCFSFWWTLEQEYATSVRKAPSSSVEMLRWFWSGREEFVKAYRKRVGATALAYL